MSKNNHYHNADIFLKDFWRNNDRFADLFNASLFHGRQIIKPEELEEQDTEASFILEHNDHSESHKGARDLLRILLYLAWNSQFSASKIKPISIMLRPCALWDMTTAPISGSTTLMLPNTEPKIRQRRLTLLTHLTTSLMK